MAILSNSNSLSFLCLVVNKYYGYSNWIRYTHCCFGCETLALAPTGSLESTFDIYKFIIPEELSVHYFDIKYILFTAHNWQK